MRSRSTSMLFGASVDASSPATLACADEIWIRFWFTRQTLICIEVLGHDVSGGTSTVGVTYAASTTLNSG